MLQQPLSLENGCLFLPGPPQLPAPTLSCSQHVLVTQLETPTQKQAGTGLPLVPVSLAHRSHGSGQEPLSMCHTQSCSPTVGVQQQLRRVRLYFRPSDLLTQRCHSMEVPGNCCHPVQLLLWAAFTLSPSRAFTLSFTNNISQCLWLDKFSSVFGLIHTIGQNPFTSWHLPRNRRIL